MSVPKHMSGCSTVTFRTACRDCGAPVYYFSCNCGSKVFFDSLGGAWPLHGDSCLPYLVRLNLEEGHHSIDEIHTLVEERAGALGVPVPERARRLLGFAESVRSNRLNISAIPPREGITTLQGTVIAVEPRINVLRHFNLKGGPVGQGLLGTLAGESFARITVREEPDPYFNCRQFDVFVPQDSISRLGLRARVDVQLQLAVHSVIGRSSIWLATEIDRQ